MGGGGASGGGYLDGVREECLPRRLTADRGWRTFFGCSADVDAASAGGTMQASVGFERVLGARELAASCRRALDAAAPECAARFRPAPSLVEALFSTTAAATAAVTAASSVRG